MASVHPIPTRKTGAPPHISVRAALHDLGIAYDRSIALPMLWPGLPPVRLEDPDRLMRRSAVFAADVAKANIVTLEQLISVERRRAIDGTSYNVTTHAAALHARRAEELILTFAERSAALASADPPDIPPIA